jgi:DNA-directed RNA polymerase subunit L
MHNESSEVRYVTTNDCTFDQPNPYKKNILIYSLQQGEKIDFTATAIIGKGLDHAIFCPTSKCYFISTKLIIHPRINYSASQILNDAIKILKEKLANLDFISIQKNKIIFPNDKFTLPMLIVDYLQEHKTIKFAGAKCNNLLESDGCIDFICEGNIQAILQEIAEEITLDLNDVSTQIQF